MIANGPESGYALTAGCVKLHTTVFGQATQVEPRPAWEKWAV